MRDNAFVRRVSRIMHRALAVLCTLALSGARLHRARRRRRRPFSRRVRRVSRAITFVSLPFHSTAISCFIADGSRRRIQSALTDDEFLDQWEATQRRGAFARFRLITRLEKDGSLRTEKHRFNRRLAATISCNGMTDEARREKETE